MVVVRSDTVVYHSVPADGFDLVLVASAGRLGRRPLAVNSSGMCKYSDKRRYYRDCRTVPQVLQ